MPERKGVIGAEELGRRVAEQEIADRASAAPPLNNRPLAARYPERLMPIAGAGPSESLWEATLPGAPDAAALARYQRFSAAREELLIDYGYNTARAYWGDLDDIFLWCEHRAFDIFTLSDRQFRQYLGLLRRRKYSENTIRRRGVAYRHLSRVAKRLQ